MNPEERQRFVNDVFASLVGAVNTLDDRYQASIDVVQMIERKYDLIRKANADDPDPEPIVEPEAEAPTITTDPIAVRVGPPKRRSIR